MQALNLPADNTAVRLIAMQVWSSLTPEILAYLKAELEFFDKVTNVSGKLYPVPKDERRIAAAELVRQVSLSFTATKTFCSLAL